MNHKTKELMPSGDRKTRFWANQKNTFGLLPGLEGTCPGCTTAPRGCWFKAPGRKTCGCYVDNIRRIYKGVDGILEHNTKLLQSVQPEDMIALLDAEFSRFKTAELAHAKKTGTQPQLRYRLHWSGDVFSVPYAHALRAAISNHPDIQFWGYTRSFFAVPILATIPNLILYLSLDPVNVLAGLVVYDENKGQNNPRLQLCYMSDTDDFADAKEQARDILEARNEVRKMLGAPKHNTDWLKKLVLRECPVDTGKLALEEGCSKCTSCITPGTAPVWFKS